VINLSLTKHENDHPRNDGRRNTRAIKKRSTIGYEDGGGSGVVGEAWLQTQRVGKTEKNSKNSSKEMFVGQKRRSGTNSQNWCHRSWGRERHGFPAEGKSVTKGVR